MCFLEQSRPVCNIKILLVVVVLITHATAFGQIPEIDFHTADSLFHTFEANVSSHPGQVIDIANQVLAFSRAHDNVEYQGKSAYYLGRAHRYAGGLKEAKDFLETSVSINRTVDRPHALCTSLKELGVLHYLLSENEQAMRCYAEALALAKQNLFTHELIAIHNNIGNLYDVQKQYNMAILSYEEALGHAPRDKQLATILVNLGQSHAGNGNLDTALQYYRQSIAVYSKLDDASGLISSLNGIASVYWNQERDDDVLSVSFILLELQKKSGLLVDQIETHNRIGLSYLNKHQGSNGIPFFKKALTLADATTYNKKHYIYANLAYAYEQIGDFKKAYQAFRTHKQLQEDLENIDKNKHLAEVMAHYEADKKEHQIKLLQREKEVQELTLQKQVAELNRQEVIRNTIILSSALFLSLFLVILIFYRQRMRSKILLASKTEEVNQQRTLELIREHELTAMRANLEGRDHERLRISQELHDGIGGSLAGIKLQTRRVADEYNLSELQKIMKNIDSVYEEVRTLSHNLSPHKILNTAFIDLLRSQLRQAGEDGSFDTEFICFPEDTLNQLPDMIKIEVYRILQELITNIIRHARARSVEVHFTLHEGAVNLLVEDFGRGFDSSKITYGVGLRSVRSRVANVSGTLHIESSPGRGTIVNIDIPLQDENSTG